MDRFDEDCGDSTDSDPPISSARRSRSTTVHADLVGEPYQAPFATENHDQSEDDGNFDAEDTSSDEDEGIDVEDTNSDEDERIDAEDTSSDDDEDVEDYTDKWSMFSRQLPHFATHTDIQRLYPPSLHPEWQPLVQPHREHEVLDKVLSTEDEDTTISSPKSTHDEDQDFGHFQEVILHDFVIYESVNNKKNLPRGLMQTLDVVATECKNTGRGFYFDGYVYHEGRCHYLQRVLIRRVNIGALQDPGHHTTRDHIYIQSDIAQRLGKTVGEDIWYRLERPVPEYSKLFETFIGVADLMKHFVDFLTASVDVNEDVHLADFREKFIEKLHYWHANKTIFENWHTTCGSTINFMRHIARHASFLHNQVSSIDGEQAARLLRLSIWWEICPGNNFSQRTEPHDKQEQTVVTHDIKRAFERTFPAWGPDHFNLLKAVDLDEQVEKARWHRKQELGFPDKCGQGGQYLSTHGVQALTDDILERVGCAGSRPSVEADDLIGRIVILKRDELDKTKPQSELGCAYAYVRSVMVQSGRQSLFVVWTLRPRDTMCHFEHGRPGNRALYDVGNELFFSDECCCKPVLLSNIKGDFGVSAFSDHAHPGATFFIREKYLEKQNCFVTATESDLECSCRSGIPVDLQSDQSLSSTTSKCPRLQTLSLFDGCGLLTRGLEDSQIIQTTCAIEIDECAVQSSLASQTEKGEHLTASVNFCLDRWMRGLKNFPQIDLIVAGFPCVGFSRINKHSAKENAQRSCSLLACTLSYVELFLPRYVLTENVPAMAESSPACAQAICCLVEMGYQVHKCLLSARECGAPQSRKRLFLLAAAPGIPLPRDPSSFILTALSTVADAIKDLPIVDNDTTINLELPDHIPINRLLESGNVSLRKLVQKLPKPPAVANLSILSSLGLLDHRETQWYEGLHDEKRKHPERVLRRINPRSTFPAMVTNINALDTRSGPFIHPYEDRVISLEELRIAQGFQSEDVMIGPLAKCVKQGGNAVNRKVAVVLGRCIAESWREFNARGNIVTTTPWPPARETVEPLIEDEDDIESITAQTSVIEIDDDASSLPEMQLHAELDAAVLNGGGLGLGSDHVLMRRKRTRRIMDSDEDDMPEEQFAVAGSAIRRHVDSRRARKTARTTHETSTGFSNTVEDPILLSD